MRERCGPGAPLVLTAAGSAVAVAAAAAAFLVVGAAAGYFGYQLAVGICWVIACTGW